jgi:hypothetical protein
MKKIFFLLLTLALLPLLSYPSAKVRQLQEKLDAVCKELVPDKRVDVCRVKVSKGKNGKLEIWGEVLSHVQKEKLLAAVSGKKIIDKITVLPDTSLVKKPWGLIGVSVANLKSEASHASEMATQAVLGTPVRILKKEGSWLYVQTPDHYLAWVTGASVSDMREKELQQWNTSECVIFLENYGLVYSDLQKNEIISDLVAGSILRKMGETGNFLQILLPDGRQGFTEKEGFVMVSEWEKPKEITLEALIATARKFLGIPYLWGGTSSKMIDCSGFIKNIWFLNGVILERDASQQFKHGDVVDPGEHFEKLQPGDVLFFGRKDPLRIVHTGLHIGNGEVIHASTRVMINSMDPSKSNYSSYLGTTYVGTKRITGQKPQFGYMQVREHPWY